MRKFVVIESPYAGDVVKNLAYLDRCLLDSLGRDETPYASHRMLTSALDDGVAEDRALGIAAGLDAAAATEATVVFYMDLGLSDGMRGAMGYHLSRGAEVRLRWLDPEPFEIDAR